MGASSSTPSASPPVREASGPAAHPRGLEVRDLSEKTATEQVVKHVNAPERAPSKVVKQDLEHLKASFAGNYGPEDLAVLQGWRDDAIFRAGAGAAGLGGSTYMLLRYFKPQFITSGRKFILVSAVSLWGGLVGALSTSPKWLKAITEIDRPDSQIKREVIGVIIKHNPRFFEQQVEFRARERPQQ